MSPHKFSPQLRLQHLQLVFFGTTVLQSLSRCRPFFPAGKNPYFLQAGKQPYFKDIFKESSSKSFCTRFLTKKVKVRKKETFAFFGSWKKKTFFHHKVLLRTKLTFFWSQSISEWRNLFFTQNGEMAKWRRNQCWPKKVGKHWKRNMMLILGVFGTIQKYAIAFLRFLLVLPFSFSRFWQRLQTANEPLAAWVGWLLLGGPPLQLTMLTSGSHSAISYRKSTDF